MGNSGLQHFSQQLNDTFVAMCEGCEVPMVLVEAAPLGGGTAAAFSLIFHSQSPTLFPQDVYRVTHSVLGENEIFLVPVGRHEHGFVYQAIFN